MVHYAVATETRIGRTRGGVALYVQLRARIGELIERDGLQPGDALPSEPELQQRFAVSRATVRQALADLERSGLIERHQGRGTFVALPRLERTLPDLTSFTEHLAEQRIRSASRLVAFERLRPGEATERAVSEDEPAAADYFPNQAVVRFVRLRLANDTPVGIHTTITPASVAESIGLTDERLRRELGFSFYKALEAAGSGPSWAEEHLAARGTSAAESRLLGMPRGTPVMNVLRLSRSADERLLEAVRAVYLGDKYDYVVQLERRHRSSGLKAAPRGGADE